MKKYKHGAIELHFNSTLKGHNKRFKLNLSRVIEALNPFLQGQKLLGEELHLTKGQAVQFNLTLCGNQKIRTLNREYRNKDKITDVLSFPVYDSLRSKLDFYPPLIELGDLYICYEVALRQAKDFDITLEQEIIHQVVHGLLHLVGYDHELSEKEERVMLSLEDNLVKKIYAKL